MDSDPEHSGQDDDSLCRVGNFNSQFARKLTTLEFNDKFSIIVPLRLGGENKKMVREDTNHSDNILHELVNEPLATKHQNFLFLPQIR